MNKFETFLEYLPKKIEYWILLFFVIRLIGINNPPLENIHNFRQSTVWMVAKNFEKIDNNILYPRVDFSGNNSGITPMEFPILNYLIYLLSKVFGFQHWLGRLIVLLVASIGLFSFYKILLRFLATNWAKAATFLLMLSIFFTYSRKTMPDVFSISLIAIGLHFFVYFLESNKFIFNILFIVFSGMGMLSKASSFPFFLSFLAWIIWENKRKININTVFLFSISFGIISGVVFWYYKIWCPYLLNIEPNESFFLGNSISEGIRLLPDYIPLIAQKFYFEAMKWSGFVLFLGGFFLSLKKNEKSIYILSIFSILSGFLFVLISLKTFATHSYYIIPLVPFMSIIAAKFIFQIQSKKWILAVLMIYSLESILSHKTDFYIAPNNRYIENLSKEIKGLVATKELVLINSNQNPTPLYFADRKGWTASNESISDTFFVDSLLKKGLGYIIILKKGMGGNIQLNHQIIKETENFTLYKL